jgi:hypothetical protein
MDGVHLGTYAVRVCAVGHNRNLVLSLVALLIQKYKY